ncbi:MAG: hotdog fold thioesterase [Candidatus Acidiferrales bacterium]
MNNEFSEREARVRESFSRQGFMRHLGAEVTALVPGECEIKVPYRQEMTQQHGYFHAGVAAAIADSACGYAAYGLMPVTSSVLTVEYKINLVAPAAGETLIARARVTELPGSSNGRNGRRGWAGWDRGTNRRGRGWRDSSIWRKRGRRERENRCDGGADWSRGSSSNWCGSGGWRVRWRLER